MRIALAFLALIAGSSAAWDFSPRPVCSLLHATESAEIQVTYDTLVPVYAITIQLREGSWPPGPVFAIQFDGPRQLTISTDRHSLSDGNRSLTVADSGFGNVLDGLEFNRSATALLGSETVEIPLAGAASEVQKFRACTEAPLT